MAKKHLNFGNDGMNAVSIPSIHHNTWPPVSIEGWLALQY
jgi:hypothetical protein